MTMTTEDITASGLPGQFADFEPFAEWIIETQNERYSHRLETPMAGMQAFYDAVMPRLPEIIEYCNRYSLDDMPDHVRNLMLLTFSLIQASFPVECWKQARVPDSGAAGLDCIREPQL